MKVIKRLEIKAEFVNEDVLDVFSTKFNSGDDPPTIIKFNGREFVGEVEYIIEKDNIIFFKIRML